MNNIALTVHRQIKASPAEVYDVWLDANNPGGPWFGCERLILDPVVDGLFYHCVRFENRDWAHYGRFVRLERPRLIEHTWVSEATKGIESVLTLTLEARGNETDVTIHHANLPDDAMGRQHQEGWNFALDAIAQRFDPKA